MSHGIGSCTRCLSHAIVVALNWLSHGIGCRTELVVARNWLSHGIGCHTELVVTRNWLSHAMLVAGDCCRTELVVARNWLSHGTGCRTGLRLFSRGNTMVVARECCRTRWLSHGIGFCTRWLSHAMVVARNSWSRGIVCRTPCRYFLEYSK